MATETEKVAAAENRRKIPQEWQTGFLDWSDDALLSLHEDESAPVEIRWFAIWELDYRLAFDVSPLPEAARPPVDRTRWTSEGMRANIARLRAGGETPNLRAALKTEGSKK